MDRHLGSLFSWIIISNPQPNSPEVYDFKLLPCCYNKKVHFICLAYYHIKERRHCFLNSNTTRYVIKDRIRKKKKKRNMSEWNPATHPKYAAQTSHSCPSLCNPMDDSPPGSSVAGILQATLEWDAITFSRGSSLPRSWTQLSCVSCNGRQVL